jgi:transmembrane 9 superfamily protein 2/4
MLEDTTCKHLCTSVLGPDASDFLVQRISEFYSLNWLVDGLPAAEMKQDDNTHELFYSMGFSLGSLSAPEGDEQRVQINNHYDIYIEYHSRDGVHNRVVGVVVWPSRCVTNEEACERAKG